MIYFDKIVTTKKTFHCFMCYHHPFQYVQLSALYMAITPPVLSKGHHCNTMQLLHSNISINYRKSFHYYFYRESLCTNKQGSVCQLAFIDWGYTDTCPINDHSQQSLIIRCITYKMYCAGGLLIPACPSFC